MDNLKASIIINTYNGNQKHLVEAVSSCLNQKRVEIDLIVSTLKNDPATKTLKGYNLRFCINDRPGIYYQLNNALKMINSDWWSYISGNDTLLLNKTYQEISLCLKNNKKICYSAYNVVDNDLNFKRINRFFDYSFAKHLEGNFVNDAAIVHKSVLDKYGPMTEEFDNLGYWDFWLRVGKEHPEYFIYNNNPVFNYRISKNSRHIKRKASPEWRKKELRERRKMLIRHGPLSGIYKI